ncbi:hypothetical protein HDU93_001812 [Gonapodya sp. JEL0774]|nr:hypothetical protein HDU93_001812 [Gonapodya sp. JEL0774]
MHDDHHIHGIRLPAPTQSAASQRLEDIVRSLLGGAPHTSDSDDAYEALANFLGQHADPLRTFSTEAYRQKGRRGSVELDFTSWDDIIATTDESATSSRAPTLPGGQGDEEDVERVRSRMRARHRAMQEDLHGIGASYKFGTVNGPTTRDALLSATFVPHHDLPFHPRAIPPERHEHALARAIRLYDPELEAVVVVRIRDGGSAPRRGTTAQSFGMNGSGLIFVAIV